MLRPKIVIAAVILICVTATFSLRYVLKQRHDARIARIVAGLRSSDSKTREAARAEFMKYAGGEDMRRFVHPGGDYLARLNDASGNSEIPIAIARTVGKHTPQWLLKGASELGRGGDRIELGRYLVSAGHPTEAVPVLTPLLESSNADIQEEAINILLPLRDSRSFEPLVRSFQAAPAESMVAYDSAYAIAALGSARAADYLLSGLKNLPALQRAACANALKTLNDPRVVPALVEALQDRDTDVARSAAEALGTIGDPQAVEPLMACVKQDRFPATALSSLGLIGDSRAVEPLMACVRQDRFPAAALSSLGLIGDDRAVPLLIAELNRLPNASALNAHRRDTTPQQQETAARALNALFALERIGTPEARKAVDAFIAPVDLADMAKNFPERFRDATRTDSFGVPFDLFVIRYGITQVTSALTSLSSEPEAQRLAQPHVREWTLEASAMQRALQRRRNRQLAGLESTAARAASGGMESSDPL